MQNNPRKSIWWLAASNCSSTASVFPLETFHIVLVFEGLTSPNLAKRLLERYRITLKKYFVVGSLQLLVNCISLSLEVFLYNFSPTWIDFIKLGERIIQKIQSITNESIWWLASSNYSSTASEFPLKTFSIFLVLKGLTSSNFVIRKIGRCRALLMSVFGSWQLVNRINHGIILKVYQGKTDAVDEQLEGANYQILSLVLLYIF